MFKPSYLKSGSFEDFLDSETGKKKKGNSVSLCSTVFFLPFLLSHQPIPQHRGHPKNNRGQDKNDQDWKRDLQSIMNATKQHDTKCDQFLTVVKATHNVSLWPNFSLEALKGKTERKHR